jgi:membrane fusion protein (multidrug efflux system)
MGLLFFNQAFKCRGRNKGSTMSEANPAGPQPEKRQPGDGQPPPDKKRGSFLKKPWVILLGAVLLALGCFYGLRYLVNSHSHESTDDAFIEANIVSLAPKVAGQVIGVRITDNQFVRQGDLLVEIDPRDYETRVNQKQAALQAAETGLLASSNNLEVARSRLNTAQANLAQRQDQAKAAEATAIRAEKDLHRNQELLKNRTISPQEFDAAHTTATSAQANFDAALQLVSAAIFAVREAESQLATAQNGIENAWAQIKQAQADLQAAQLQLSYTKILAPVDGRVTRKAVEPGSYLQVGQIIFALVPTNVWVDANFKETQLKLMRPGQPVSITVSAYPKNHYRGHVDSIQAGSGSRFSLLPPENAVGNFVKVVQRVPVKILFDDRLDPHLVFGPGMSVVPSVRVRNFYVPDWILLLIALVVGILIAALGLRRSAKSNSGEESAGDFTHEPAKA